MDKRKIAGYREILDCLEQPAFLTQGSTVVLSNSQAAETESTVKELLRCEELPDTFTSGGKAFHLDVRPMEDYRLLLASPLESQQAATSAAVRAIRTPLSNLFSVAATLLPYLEEQEDPRIQQQTAELNRGLYQLFRVVGNMEAVSSVPVAIHREKGDLCAFLHDLVQRATPLCEISGVHLSLALSTSPIFAYLDPQRLERAVLNLLSNALRFAEQGSTITIRLEQLRDNAVIRMTNMGQPVDSPDDVFHRSLAEPGDPKFGAGLGLTIVREVAREHGGALVFRALDHGFAADFSISLAAPGGYELRSPRLRYDYAGGFDHLLVELSDALPSAIYNSICID